LKKHERKPPKIFLYSLKKRKKNKAIKRKKRILVLEFNKHTQNEKKRNKKEKNRILLEYKR
jgi:hypothetical protein